MKKPSNLKLKEDNKVKRNKSIPNNFESRKKNYNELKELREILKQKKSDVADSMRAERKRIEEKRKRKELNDIKSGKYDVVICFL